MGFFEAISDAFAKYARFSGRSSRAAYWWFYLFTLIVFVIAAAIDAALDTGGIVYALVAIGLLLPSVAVTVRRFHDAGHSGWWLLLLIVPLIGVIVALIFTLQGSKPPNKWGPGPDHSTADTPTVAA